MLIRTIFKKPPPQHDLKSVVPCSVVAPSGPELKRPTAKLHRTISVLYKSFLLFEPSVGKQT